jgi:hypothetical protein
VVKELDGAALAVSQPLSNGGMLHLICREATVTCTGADASGKALPWAWEMVGGDLLAGLITRVATDSITFRSSGVDYEMKIAPAVGTCQQAGDRLIRLIPNSSGKLLLILGGQKNSGSSR